MGNNINNKTLSEALDEIDDKTLIYLGAQSSFFDIATAGKLKSDIYLDNLSLILYKTAEIKVQLAKSNFSKALETPPVWKGPKEDESEDKSIKKYIETMSRWPNRLKSMKDNIQVLENYFEMFVPLKDRVVRDIYPRLDGSGICVIIHGNETGDYWMLSEKENDVKMLPQY